MELCEESIESCLREQGMRVTRPRRRLIVALLAADRPLTADDLTEQGHFSPSERVSVYRNLEAFQVAGIVQRFLLENGLQLFELTAPGDHFHHVVCRNCHRAERLETCAATDLEKEALAAGFTDISHHFEIYGLCGNCRPKAVR